MSEQKLRGWAHPDQRIEMSSKSPRPYHELGLLFHINLQGTPLPVYGCFDRKGDAWRLTPEMAYEDRAAGILRWESQWGEKRIMSQAEAVNRLGFNANYVYNPYVNSRADMGIETPDGWSRLFPLTPDYNEVEEPKLVVQPQLAEKSELRFTPEPAPFTFQPNPAPTPTAPAPYHVTETFYPLPKPSSWEMVKAFFKRIFGR